jgi:hypothetical protein
MRIAAGVLLLIEVICAPLLGYITFLIAWYWGALFVVFEVLLLLAGIFTLQARHWRFCFVLSIIGVEVIPAVFIGIRRSEWES